MGGHVLVRHALDRHWHRVAPCVAGSVSTVCGGQWSESEPYSVVGSSAIAGSSLQDFVLCAACTAWPSTAPEYASAHDLGGES